MNNRSTIFLCLIFILGSVIHSHAASSITEVTYFSKTMNSNRTMNVYLPDGYNQNTYYPTFYLMHGGGQRYYTWANPVDGNAKAILDQAISSGKAVPMIVVMPDVPDFAPDLFTRELCDDVIPFVEKTYRARPGKDNRALAGLSWGGLQVLDAGLYRYDLFGYLGVFSSGWFIGDNIYNVMRTYLAANGSKIEASMRYFYFGEGGRGDIAYDNGMETMKLIRAHGITVNYWEHSGGHSFVCWRQDLQDFLPFLFKHAGPEVAITAPAANTSFTAPATVDFTATASAPNGSVSNVEFFNGTTKLGEDATAPYAYSWTNVAAGSYTITAVATDNEGNKTTSAAVSINVNVPQGPYNNVVHSIPGIIQSEHFDVGGNGIAYSDNSPGSETGVAFRADEDVDIENCTDAGGGYNIGWATAGEWLEYTANVQNTGIYDLSLRLACNGTGRTISVSVNGAPVADNIAVPNTADWQSWTTVTIPDIDLTAGEKVIRVTIGPADYVNLNYISFAEATVTGVRSSSAIEADVYPNPFTEAGIRIDYNGKFNYQITDISGSLLEEGEGEDLQIAGTDLMPGSYLITIKNNKGLITKKILKY